MTICKLAFFASCLSHAHLAIRLFAPNGRSRDRYSDDLLEQPGPTEFHSDIALNPFKAVAEFLLALNSASAFHALSGLQAARLSRQVLPSSMPNSMRSHDPRLSADSTLEVDALVVGAGISGSTLAHNLHRSGVNTLLAEARDYVGGNVKSHVTDDGFVWEEGPNSFAAQPSIVRIASELGIADQLVFADESLPPWVNHNGKLHPLPKGKGGKGPKGQLELVFGSNGVLKFGLLGDLLSIPGTIRAAVGAFIGHAPPPEGKEETIREWVTRILGEEVFLRCIDPFVSGVYAGDPETLSIKAALSKIARIERYAYSIEWNKLGAIFYGGLKRQVELTKERKANPPDPSWPEFEYGNPGSFRKGLATLPNAISEELGQPVGGPINPDAKVKLGWKLKKVARSSNGNGYVATFDKESGGVATVNARTIVSTVPAHALGGVLDTVMPEAAPLVDEIREQIGRKGIYYPPVCAVTVAYPKSAFKDVELANGFGSLQNLPGFGSLNPRTEGVRTLGVLWSSSLFPERAPPDYNLLLNYIGGSRDIALAELSEEEIFDQVDSDARKVLLKPDAPPPKKIGFKLWPSAIPQYELGHLGIIEKLEAAEAKTPGLWICGNYKSGVAFPDCVTFGYEHAQVVREYLKQAPPAVTSAKESAQSPDVKEEPVASPEISAAETADKPLDAAKTEALIKDAMSETSGIPTVANATAASAPLGADAAAEKAEAAAAEPSA